MITADLLRGLGVGNSASELYAPLLAEACPQWDIDEPREVAAFLANCCHESAYFTRLEENLNYSANRLRVIWPNRVTPEDAIRLAHKPREIALHVYSNRMGNGPAETGDGWNFRGRGLPMITGRDNYRALSAAWGVDLLSNPEILLEPDGAVVSACWFWRANGFDKLAQAGDWAAITRRWNGGMNGHEERVRLIDLVLGYLA